MLHNKSRTARRNQCSSMLLIVGVCIFELVTLWSHFEMEGHEGASADLSSQFFESFVWGSDGSFGPFHALSFSKSRRCRLSLKILQYSAGPPPPHQFGVSTSNKSRQVVAKSAIPCH